MNNKTGIIYCATNPKNQKVYIGQTIQTLGRRKSAHRKYVSKGRYYCFQEAIKKYGFDIFDWQIICTVTALTNVLLNKYLNIAEQIWIKQYDSYKNGYNETEGGESKIHLKGKKRKPFSKEWKLNLSLAHKGYKLSEETKKKLSLAHKGLNTWQKDRKASEETKRKISIAHKKNPPFKGRHHTAEAKEKNRLAHIGNTSAKGYHHTEKTKRKLSESHKGNIAWNKGTKGLMPDPWNKGIPWSEKIKQKMSESAKGKIPWNKGKHHTKEAREKIRQAHLGREPWNKGKKTGPQSEETIQKRSESNKRKKMIIGNKKK